MLALSQLDTMLPLLALSSGESNIILSTDVLGLIPGVSPEELVDGGPLVVFLEYAVLEYTVETVKGLMVVGAAVENVEEVGEVEEMM